MTEFEQQPVTIAEDGEVTVDVEFVAPDLGLSPEQFMAEMRAGRVFQTAEKGVGEDEGKLRLTFRHRAKETSFVVDSVGQIVTNS